MKNSNKINEIIDIYNKYPKDFEKMVFSGVITIAFIMAGIVVVFKNPIMTILYLAIAVFPGFIFIKAKQNIQSSMNKEEKNSIDNSLLTKEKKIKNIAIIIGILMIIIAIIIKVIMKN